MTDTGTWKSAEVVLKNALFSGSENLLADMRLLGQTVRVRNVSIEPK